MRNIHLYGHLAKEFGDSHTLDVATAGEAIRALNSAFPGKFVSVLREGSYRVIRGRKIGGFDIDLDILNTFQLGKADLHIIPVAHGAKSSKGTVKAVVGIGLVGSAIFLSGGTLAAPLGGMAASAFTAGGLSISFGNIALLGLGTALAGIAQHYAKADATPKQSAQVDPAASFSFSGPINTNAQGAARALIYGAVIAGSQPISSEFDIEDIGAYAP